MLHTTTDASQASSHAGQQLAQTSSVVPDVRSRRDTCYICSCVYVLYFRNFAYTLCFLSTTSRAEWDNDKSSRTDHVGTAAVPYKHSSTCLLCTTAGQQKYLLHVPQIGQWSVCTTTGLSDKWSYIRYFHTHMTNNLRAVPQLVVDNARCIRHYYREPTHGVCA